MPATFLQTLSLAAFAHRSRSFHSASQLASPAPALVTVVAPFGGDSTTVLSTEVLGVGSDGRTTYALAQNAMQGSSVLVSATGTLVEGSDHVSYTYALAGNGLTINVGADCALSGGDALCGVAGSNGLVVGLVGPRRRVDCLSECVDRFPERVDRFSERVQDFVEQHLDRRRKQLSADICAHHKAEFLAQNIDVAPRSFDGPVAGIFMGLTLWAVVY
ncbi:hypothetical protein DFH09DRAFT_1344067 [Mycena vulgaris]|nr:hypothetical protein DFH09DRAFT_1344067 [Mycena vulgaris]